MHSIEAEQVEVGLAEQEVQEVEGDLLVGLVVLLSFSGLIPFFSP